MSIANVVRTAAERFGADLAVADGARSLSFAELSDRVHRLAAGFAARGVAPGGAVSVLLPNSVASIEVDLALTIGGFVRVALNPRVGQRDWARIMDDCRPCALVYDPGVDGAREFAAAAPVSVLIAAVDDDTGTATLDGIAAAAPARPRLRELEPNALCALHYSSGTTGVPKGAKRTHANRLASLRAMLDHVLAGTLDGPEPPVFVHAGPVIHTSGLFVLPFLAAGGKQVLLDHARPAELLAAVAGCRGTHTALVPTVIARLLEFGDAELTALRRLRMLAYAGAPMPVEHIRQAYHRITPNLVQYYGMVEAIPPLTVLGIAAHRRGMDEDSEILASVGRPCAGVDIDFRDGDVAVSDGQIGELVIAGPAVGPGYHDAGTRTDLGKSHRGGRLHSGDLGFRAADGYLHLTGRSKDMIITGGYNVYPREVEQALLTIPGVTDAVVVGLADPVWGQRIVAAYTAESRADLTEAELTDPELTDPELTDPELTEVEVLRRSREVLPDYKRPKSVHRLPAFPLTALGKVDRAAVARMLAPLTSRSVVAAPSRA
ncbi:class I adenylate-forming enzyme family protein [Nocardia shimofusensis]|uniref:class I adenylate-forming enzyme family protein n=1 Tax=Nocardia shimofusensis TaxID=228596 RepID=UPI00082C9900|nr:AMP-binding protein [Nocardia shimofusensis]